jgi:predicted transcriptional regulator
MACVNPDGTLTASALALLEILMDPLKPEEIALRVGQPLFKVRSSLREMSGAGLLTSDGDHYVITAEGSERLLGR